MIRVIIHYYSEEPYNAKLTFVTHQQADNKKTD